MQVASSQYPQIYADLGINPNNLGCVMLDVEPIVVSDIINPDDLLEADPARPHTGGVVSETGPHCTLLYGLLRPGPELRKHVDAVLDGWEPEEVTIDDVSAFEVTRGEDQYVCIVAKLQVTEQLAQGNARLRLLPHIDTFGDYTPHVTLAYLKAESGWQQYIEPLSERLKGMTVAAQGINYGD